MVSTMNNVLSTFFNGNKIDRRRGQKAMLTVMTRLNILLDFTKYKI